MGVCCSISVVRIPLFCSVLSLLVRLSGRFMCLCFIANDLSKLMLAYLYFAFWRSFLPFDKINLRQQLALQPTPRTAKT